MVHRTIKKYFDRDAYAFTQDSCASPDVFARKRAWYMHVFLNPRALLTEPAA
jgi:hypothetical protein